MARSQADSAGRRATGRPPTNAQASIEASDRLRRALLDRGLSQRGVAEQLHVSSRTVGRWCTGDAGPDRTSAAKLADVLDVPDLVSWWTWPASGRTASTPPETSQDATATDEQATGLEPEPESLGSVAPGALPRRPWIWWVVIGAPVLVLVAVLILVLQSRWSTVGSGTTVTTIRFNSLGGTTSTVVQVYAGAGVSNHDRTAVAIYNHGDTVAVSCKEVGRLVSSDTAAGEESRSTDLWVRLAVDGPEPQFATLTYADIDPEALTKLGTCT